MRNNRFLRIYTEEEIKAMGVEGYLALREKASKEGDLQTLLDIAVYRFINGCDLTNIDVLPELFYLLGKSKDLSRTEDILKEYSWTLMTLPQDCIDRAKKMFKLGLKFPVYTEKELEYLESLLCDSNSYKWMEIIMYDENKLSRSVKHFDQETLKVIHSNFSDEFLLQIYDSSILNEDEQEYPYCYDKKINNIRRIDWYKVGSGEYVIEIGKPYKEVHKHLKETYGIDCANSFARSICPSFMTYEELVESDIFISPCLIIKNAENIFKIKSQVIELKKWFSSEFLHRCNH